MDQSLPSQPTPEMLDMLAANTPSLAQAQFLAAQADRLRRRADAPPRVSVLMPFPRN
jgi:hypothetical protein